MNRTKWTWLQLLAVVLLAGVWLVACSGSGTEAPASTDESAAAVTDDTADEAMADEAADEAMADDSADEAMADEAMADEAMADEAMADEAMADDSADAAADAAADEAMADEEMTEADDAAMSGRTRLNVGIPYMTEILDAQQAFGGSYIDVEQIGQALVRIDDATGELIPDLVESWQFADDNLALTMTLPPGLVYSNGDPLDAQAVADALLRNKEISPYASDFAALADVVVVDATTLQMVFSDPPAAFLTVLNSSFGGPWNVAHAVEVGNEAFAVEPVASGPLMIAEVTPGVDLLLVRNENYTTNMPLVENRGPLHLEEVHVRAIPEPLTLVGELEAGTIDMVVGVPASAVSRLRQNPEITVQETRQAGAVGLVMNLTHPLFSDIQVRQAIAQAVDRDALVTVVEGAAPVYSYVTPGMIAYSDEVAAYTQSTYPLNVAAAQELMAAAGWEDSDGDGIVEKDGAPFTAELLVVSTNPAQQQAGQLLQVMLREIGIDIQIVQEEGQTAFQSKSAGEYMMGFDAFGWPDPDILSIVFGAPFWNFAQYDNPELLEQMTAARYMMDIEERTAAYVDIQRTLLDDLVEIPLWQEMLFVAIQDEVQGLVRNGRHIFLNDVIIVEQ